MKNTQFGRRKLIEKKGGMMHAYANTKALTCLGQILINQLFALPSSKTEKSMLGLKNWNMFLRTPKEMDETLNLKLCSKIELVLLDQIR